jgi:hypothetical protein
MDMRVYLIHANQWKQYSVDYIWWEVHKSELISLSPKKRQFAQTMIHGKLPSYYCQNKMCKYKPSVYSACKSAEIETQDHIFQCKSCPAQEKLRKKYNLKLGIILENHPTNAACKLII